MNKKMLSEVTNQIYDTLMGNVGMSEFHTAFPAELVSEQECDAGNQVINFTLEGISYRVSIEEVETFPISRKKDYGDEDSFDRDWCGFCEASIIVACDEDGTTLLCPDCGNKY